jgi:16S rRNA U516 pseudouridylate synthase RsuA-like enzyme
VRTRVGPVVLGDLPSGAARPLRSSEIQALRRKLRLPSS